MYKVRPIDQLTMLLQSVLILAWLASVEAFPKVQNDQSALNDDNFDCTCKAIAGKPDDYTCKCPSTDVFDCTCKEIAGKADDYACKCQADQPIDCTCKAIPGRPDDYACKCGNDTRTVLTTPPPKVPEGQTPATGDDGFDCTCKATAGKPDDYTCKCPASDAFDCTCKEIAGQPSDYRCNCGVDRGFECTCKNTPGKPDDYSCKCGNATVTGTTVSVEGSLQPGGNDLGITEAPGQNLDANATIANVSQTELPATVIPENAGANDTVANNSTVQPGAAGNDSLIEGGGTNDTAVESASTQPPSPSPAVTPLNDAITTAANNSGISAITLPVTPAPGGSNLTVTNSSEIPANTSGSTGSLNGTTSPANESGITRPPSASHSNISESKVVRTYVMCVKRENNSSSPSADYLTSEDSKSVKVDGQWLAYKCKSGLVEPFHVNKTDYDKLEKQCKALGYDHPQPTDSQHLSSYPFQVDGFITEYFRHRTPFTFNYVPKTPVDQCEDMLRAAKAKA